MKQPPPDEEITMFARLSSAEQDAFFEYAKALAEGKAKPPEGTTVSGDLEKVIDQMLLMKTVLRVKDHNSIADVRHQMALVDPRFLDAAMDYMPTARTLM